MIVKEAFRPGSFRSIVGHVVLGLIIFFSTGAILDVFLASGSIAHGMDLKDVRAPEEGRTRLLVWLLIYSVAVYYVAISLPGILSFLKRQVLFLALIIYLNISSLWAQDQGASLYASLQLTYLSIVAIAFGYLMSLERLKYILFVVLTIIGVLSYFSWMLLPDIGTSVYEGEYAVRGIFVEKNRLGQLLTFFFSIVMFLFFINGKGRTKLLLPFMLGFVLLIFVNSKTAIVITLVTPALYFLSFLFIGSKQHVVRVLLVLVPSVIFILFLADLLFIPVLELLGKDPTLTGRTELWDYSYKAILDRPFWGYGFSSYWNSLAEYGGMNVSYYVSWAPMSMHNDYFETTLQLGFVGLFLYLCVLVSALVASIRYATIRYVRMGYLDTLPFVIFMLIVLWGGMQSNMLRHQAFFQFIFVMFYSSCYFNYVYFKNGEE